MTALVDVRCANCGADIACMVERLIKDGAAVDRYCGRCGVNWGSISRIKTKQQRIKRLAERQKGVER